MEVVDIHSKIPSTDFFYCQTCTQTKSTKGTEELFLKSVSVWINKPHVVNRRLCGSKTLAVRRSDTKGEIVKALTDLSKKFEVKGSCADIDTSFKDLSEEASVYTLLIRELIPKSDHFPNILEAVLFDKSKTSISFIPLELGRLDTTKEVKSTQELYYVVSFNKLAEPSMSDVNEMSLSWACDHNGEYAGVQRQMSSIWFQTILLEKLVMWSQINDISTSATSLQLVPVDKYKDTYVRLKNTYGKDLVKNWTESTDPKKFVYEDIAIAAYLLLIWEEDRELKNLTEKQSFVDLGCGNGLLVYILTREGHRGLGIDLRKRKIWDTFGPDIELQEKTVTPSGDQLFPDFDWIIGNHSDELTPWIPVITARSSYNCCLFLLPCCFHDFTGKYGHMEKGKSQYGSYLDYVKEIIYTCGFHPECDTLRIPSTKRICYLGRQRSYLEEHEAQVDSDRQAFIDKRVAHVNALNNMRNRRSKPYLGTVFLPQDGPIKTSASIENGAVASATSTDPTNCDISKNASADNLTLLTKKRKLSKNSEENLDGPTVDRDQKKLCDLKQKAGMPSKKKDVEKTHESTSLLMTCESTDNSSDTSLEHSQWAAGFKPRVEGGARNCQLVSKETKEKIVTAVFNKVLEADTNSVAILDNGTSWRRGGAVPLIDVVALCAKSILLELKKECGGLQTLLRNHSHIFQVTGGTVRLRDFSKADPWEGRDTRKSNNKGRKVKCNLCWFNAYHPDGCPRTTDQCLFAHGLDDLKIQNQT